MGFEHAVENTQGAWIATSQRIESGHTARIVVNKIEHCFALLSSMFCTYAQAAHHFIVAQRVQRLNAEKIVERGCLVVGGLGVTRCGGDQHWAAARLQIVSQRPLVACWQTSQDCVQVVD